MSHDYPESRDLNDPEVRLRIVERYMPHLSPEKKAELLAELDEEAAKGTLPTISDENWGRLERGEELQPERGLMPARPVYPKETNKPSRRGDERRKVRWVTSREGRSKYAPHAGAKELAKIVARDTSDLL